MTTTTLPTLNQGCALFLDIDGTLLPIAESPSAVRPDSTQVMLLEALRQAMDGALALVSGRPLADIDRLYHPQLFPAAGQHGAEIRDGRGEVVSVVGASNDPFAMVRPMVLEKFLGAHDILIEDKGRSMAVHYRQAPQRRDEVEAFLQRVVADQGAELVLQAGKMVFEMKPSGIDKGKAIQTLMGKAPFAGKKPVFVGDDTTDEDGFEAVNRLGGETIKVGSGPTFAAHRVTDTHEVRIWLQRCLTCLNLETAVDRSVLREKAHESRPSSSGR